MNCSLSTFFLFRFLTLIQLYRRLRRFWNPVVNCHRMCTYSVFPFCRIHCPGRLSEMTNVWSRIATFTHKYPLTRGMMSYACIWPLGSCVQQKIQGKENLDYWRAFRFSLYGCCFVAPTLYTWMTVAGYLFPRPGLRSGICKVSWFQVKLETSF